MTTTDRTIEVPCIIVTGNPADGHHHIGPFDTFDEANEYADNSTALRADNWWIIELESPREVQPR